MILILLALLFYIVVTICYGAYLWETHLNRTKPGRVIYYSSNLNEQGEVLAQLIERYITQRGETTDDYTLVEPGAGFGHVARYLSKRYVWREVQAVEIGPVVLAVGRMYTLFRRDKVKFILADIFSYAMPKKSFVYCYLSSDILDQMYQKGHFRGQLVVCLTFAITGCTPEEEIPLQSWQKRILVYDFRPSDHREKEIAQPKHLPPKR
jgi:hypothetical protein